MYAVFSDETNTITFVARIPKWFQGQYEEGVTIDPPPEDLYIWPLGTDRPECKLCVSRTDSKHYRVYKYQKDIDLEQFTPTGKNYGGILLRPPGPSPRERRRAEFRGRNAGRWIAWTRNFGKPVATGDTRDEALAKAARRGHADVICEWIEPLPSQTSSGRP